MEAIAAPIALNLGISKKFNNMFIIQPKKGAMAIFCVCLES